MVIKPKKMPVIQKGNGYVYNPATFAKEHKQPNFFVVDTPEEMLQRVKPFEFKGRKFIVFDTETSWYYKTSQDVPVGIVRRWIGTGKAASPQDYPFCISINDGKNSYTMYDDVETGFKKFRALAPLLEDPTVEKIAHNIGFDMHMLMNAGCKIVGRIHDTVIITKLVDENRKSYKLRDLAVHYDKGIVKYEYMVDSWKQLNKVSNYKQIPRELLSEYANADVHNCHLAFINEYDKLEADGLVELYENEMELRIALFAMERSGMRLDATYREPLIAELQKESDEAERAIYDEAGKMFNINSTKQLYNTLISLGTDPLLISATDKGNPKLDKEALEDLAEHHNVTIVKKILDYRKYDKLLNTYAVGIYSQRDSEDKVHGSINQSEAVTGRMSITKPALQTLGKKDKHIRSAFIPDDNCMLYFQDLDQIEFRGFAHYAKASSILEAIANGYDVHTATAATIFHMDIKDLADKVHSGDAEANALRAKAKTVNFALLYGVGQQHLAEIMNCSVTEAAQVKSDYFANLPAAKAFIDTVQQVIKMRGYVKNFYGRRRRLDSDDCYKAPNALIQGWAADYIKHKMVDIYKYLMYHGYKTKMINVVHDEIVFNMPLSEEHIAPELRWLMSDFTTFRCPMTAGAEFAMHDWGHKEEREVGFNEPVDKGYLSYNVFNGDVFTR